MGHKIWSGKNAVADPGEGSPLFLDQTEARRAEKNILETRPSPLSAPVGIRHTASQREVNHDFLHISYM